MNDVFCGELSAMILLHGGCWCASINAFRTWASQRQFAMAHSLLVHDTRFVDLTPEGNTYTLVLRHLVSYG